MSTEHSNNELQLLVRSAVNDALNNQSLLTEEERQWVRLAIRKEAQSIKLREAIIEKSLAGLVWAGMLALGAVILEYAKSHGMWRP